MKIKSDLVTIDGVVYLDTFIIQPAPGLDVLLCRSIDIPEMRPEIIAEHLKELAKAIVKREQVEVSL